MNILIFSWRGLGHKRSGGAEIVTHQHAKYWAKQGHNVVIFTSFEKGLTNSEIIDDVQYIRQGQEIVTVQIHAFIWYILSTHYRFDLVIDQFHGIPFFTPLFVRVPVLALIHEVAIDVWKLNPLSKPFNLIPSILGPYLEPLIFKLLYKEITFMTVSKSTKNDLIQMGINRNIIKIISNGSDFTNVIQIPKEKIITISYLGSLTKDKGIEDVLRIFQKIQLKLKEVQFWVIGKGEEDYVSLLKKKCKEYKIESITFWGFVDEVKKFKLLSKSHVLVNPSKLEGWGLVVIEGASVGTPTVGYNVSGLRDSIKDGETGYLVNLDSDSAAEKIVDLINDKNEYQRISNNAIKWSKRFVWNKSTRNSMNLINNLVKNSSL